MSESVIKIKNLSKSYDDGVKALKDVSLDIKKGEIFALLGPNGAGKTTMINIVTGLAKRTSGTVTVLGKDVIKDYKFTRKHIGLVQQEINSDFFFTVSEMIKIQAGYFGIRNPEKKVEEVLKSLNLWDKRKTPGRKLSGGMKRRIMVAKALVHDPDILFLDEPTAGVDVELRANLWNLVKDLKQSGRTIVLTTHYLEEAEELADRVGLINEGEIILVEDKRTLLKQFGRERLVLHLSRSIDNMPTAARKLKGTLRGVLLEVNHYPKATGDVTVQELFDELNGLGVKVESLDVQKTSLNDVYLKLINHKKQS